MLWGRNTLSLLHWNHIWLMLIIWSDPSMFHGAVSPWSLHIYHYEAIQGQGPHFLPTRKATIHIHRGRGGRGSIWVHYIAGGWGGCLPNLDHIYITCSTYLPLLLLDLPYPMILHHTAKAICPFFCRGKHSSATGCGLVMIIIRVIGVFCVNCMKIPRIWGGIYL